MNKALAELLKLIQKLYGKKALSKTIGTRTNVITLPDKETKKFLSQELNIEAASDAAVKKGFEDAEKLIADIPKMNDQEILTFKNNLQRMDNRINPPSAEVISIGTKQPVSKEGIASLTEQAGQKAPPGTVMGNLESRLNQLRASGEGLEALTKGKGQTLDDILGDVMQSQKAMSKLQDEGLVRAAVRYKMMDDVKKGTLKVPKNIEDVIRGASNEEDVITVFRNNYGEDALEQVDSLIPDFYKMTSPTEAVKKIEKDFPNIQPKKIETKQTMDLEEAAKAEKENILIPDDTEEFATGGRVGYAAGGVTPEGSLSEFLKSTTLVSPSGKSYDYDFIQSLPGTPQAAAQKFGREAIYGTTVNAGDNDITTPGKYASYYNLADEGSLKQEYSFLKDYILQPENLVRDYGLEGAKKILTPYRQTTTPISTPAEEMKETYTANVTPSNLYPNNPFYSSTAKTLYPNNPFYSYYSSEEEEDDTYDQYMKNLGYQSGGRVGFQEGGNIYSMYQNYLNDLQNRASGNFSVPIGNMYQSTTTDEGGSNETESTQTSPVGSTFNPTMMDMLTVAFNPVMGIANLASRTTTGLSLAQRAMDAMGIGRGPGGRTQGYGVDSVAGMASGPTHGVDDVNSQSVGADASAGGAAGAAAASAAGANDGPGTGGSFAQGGRVEMASGGIAALKALLNFFAKQKGKKGSDMLKEINPKRLGFLQNMLMKSDKELLDANRQEYLEELSDVIKSDKKLLDKIKQMPEEARDTFFTIANEGGNRGRLSVYKNPDFNIDDAISEIEQMKKNLKFKDVPEKEVKRQMNAIGGRVGYSTGSIVKGVLLTAKTLSELKPEYLKKLSRLEGYLGSINMEGKGGREAAKKTIEKIDNLKQEYKALEKDLSEKEQLDKFDTTDRSKNARGGVAYLMGL